jgi:hypothetical protein
MDLDTRDTSNKASNRDNDLKKLTPKPLASFSKY